MPIRVACPVCGYRIKAPEGAFGRRGQCPRCKLMIRLPTEAELAARQEAAGASTDGSGGGAAAAEGSGPPDADTLRMSSDSSVEFEFGSPGQEG